MIRQLAQISRLSPGAIGRGGRGGAGLLVLLLLGLVSALQADDIGLPVSVKSRARVIVDNDFGGDPDGLFQLAQHLLSPAVEVRAVIGSHHYREGFYGSPGTSTHAVAVTRELLAVMGMPDRVPVLAGAEQPLADVVTPQESEAARFIVQEAMRADATTPLYVVCGAGLTDLASAYMIEPRIADRVRLVWIGGPEHAGLALPPPGGARSEYNLGIDVRAAQVIFNRSTISLWQVPRDAYRQALVSVAELRRRIDARGKLGGYLLAKLDDLRRRAEGSLGEAYALGDSPLVLLTALQSSWEADPSSSRYVNLPAPAITDSGAYAANRAGRTIRVYTQLDTRLMFEDLYAKIAAFDSSSAPQGTPKRD